MRQPWQSTSGRFILSRGVLAGKTGRNTARRSRRLTQVFRPTPSFSSLEDLAMTIARRYTMTHSADSLESRSRSPRRRPSPPARLTLCACLIVLGSACSSSTGTDRGFNARYIDPPQRVWANIQLTLEDLGYEIEDSDWHGGTIWATAAETEGGSKPPLFITQIKRTDVTRVHIYPDSDTKRMQTDGFQTAAREFLTGLDNRMKGKDPSGT